MLPFVPPPLVSPSTSAFYGAGASAFWGGATPIARAPGGAGQRFTVIPLPAQPSDDYTLERRLDAIASTYSGNLREAADLYRGTVEADGWMCGILDTMAHGLLGLPLSFRGDPEMCSALLDVDGTGGDFARMHPENECAKIFRDGLGLGLGLGQYLLMCWRCDSIEWLSKPGPAGGVAGPPIEVCKCCGARRIDRPAGQRELYQLRWRDVRDLWRNPVSFQWFYNGRSAMTPITPGDGEWFLFQTVPDLDCWRHGPWIWATLAAIFSRDSTFDAQNTSAVCAPIPVFSATGPTAPATRKETEAQADNLRFGNKLVLPGEWAFEIKSASADYIGVTEAIVERCSGMFEVGITGNLHGMKAGTGFANMDVYARATRERRAFYAGAWIRQIRAQGLVWWASDNFGTRNVPVGSYDVRSPEDKKAESDALKSEGDALKSYSDGLGSVGHEVEAAWVVERAQGKGIRVRPKVSATAPGAPPASPLPVAPLPDARLAPADEEPAGDPGPDHALAFAAQMTELGAPKCPHDRTHLCERCGIQRTYSAVAGKPGEPPSFPIAWRPIASAPAPVQVAA